VDRTEKSVPSAGDSGAHARLLSADAQRENGYLIGVPERYPTQPKEGWVGHAAVTGVVTTIHSHSFQRQE
jgi:hypothetical protein